MNNQTNPTFETGQLVATKAVHEKMENNQDFKNFCFKSLARHMFCDWGDLDPEDKRSNDEALKNHERLFSAYVYDAEKDIKIWIITERDRSCTTILFPEDY